jgi:hypothetical protein
MELSLLVYTEEDGSFEIERVLREPLKLRNLKCGIYFKDHIDGRCYCKWLLPSQQISD